MSIADELEKLVNLRDTGTLTEEEFQAQKTKILSSANNKNFDKTNTAENLKSNNPEAQKRYRKYIYLALPMLIAVGFGIGKFNFTPSTNKAVTQSALTESEQTQPSQSAQVSTQATPPRLSIKDGEQAYQSGDYEKALKLFISAANQGDAKAQYYLGKMYANGNGVSVNDDKAAEYYRKSAEQGYTAAQYSLGTFYHAGAGVERDYGQAIYWYRQAAEKGSAEAQSRLGVIYGSGGYGIEPNNELAEYWLRKAAEQGDVMAKNSLIRREKSTRIFSYAKKTTDNFLSGSICDNLKNTILNIANGDGPDNIKFLHINEILKSAVQAGCYVE